MKKLILSSLFMTILSSAALATPSSTDKLTDFALGKLQTLFDATTKAIPTVTKYTLQVTQMECLMGFIPVIPLLIVGCLLLYWARLLWHKEDDWDCPGVGILSVALHMVSAVPLVILVGILLDGWRWVCVLHPDIYLIHLAVQKVLG